jgi:hypothetical protein
MKVMIVERVSNADRAKYTLRASPNARLRKDQTNTISLQQGCPINDFPRSVEGAVPPFFRRRTQPGGGQVSVSPRPPSDVIGPNGPFNLATTGKNNCRDRQRFLTRCTDFLNEASKAWVATLRRRGQRPKLPWERVNTVLLKVFPLPPALLRGWMQPLTA